MNPTFSRPYGNGVSGGYGPQLSSMVPKGVKHLPFQNFQNDPSWVLGININIGNLYWWTVVVYYDNIILYPSLVCATIYAI